MCFNSGFAWTPKLYDQNLHSGIYLQLQVSSLVFLHSQWKKNQTLSESSSEPVFLLVL